jgi:hypothetical protein
MFGLTGARVQSQSEQIWMYNRYEIVMEYAKRPRLPPPFVVISYISMLITNGSRQCVLKLKEYSDKRANLSNRNHRQLKEINNNNPDSLNLNIDLSTSQLTETNENRSMLGRLLNCKPCRQVTDTQQRKVVCYSCLVFFL